MPAYYTDRYVQEAASREYAIGRGLENEQKKKTDLADFDNIYYIYPYIIADFFSRWSAGERVYIYNTCTRIYHYYARQPDG